MFFSGNMTLKLKKNDKIKVFQKNKKLPVVYSYFILYIRVSVSGIGIGPILEGGIGIGSDT